MDKEQRRKRIKEIEREVVDLNHKKSLIVVEVQTTQTNLSTIKNKFKADTVLASELKEVNLLREKYVQQYNKEISQLREINDEIRILNTEKNELQFNSDGKKVKADNVVERKLIKLRDQYVEFNRDKTRIPAMRKMAERFIDELNVVLKSF